MHHEYKSLKGMVYQFIPDNMEEKNSSALQRKNMLHHKWNIAGSKYFKPSPREGMVRSEMIVLQYFSGWED